MLRSDLHALRNQLQIVLGAIEIDDVHRAKDAVKKCNQIVSQIQILLREIAGDGHFYQTLREKK